MELFEPDDVAPVAAAFRHPPEYSAAVRRYLDRSAPSRQQSLPSAGVCRGCHEQSHRSAPLPPFEEQPPGDGHPAEAPVVVAERVEDDS